MARRNGTQPRPLDRCRRKVVRGESSRSGSCYSSSKESFHTAAAGAASARKSDFAGSGHAAAQTRTKCIMQKELLSFELHSLAPLPFVPGALPGREIPVDVSGKVHEEQSSRGTWQVPVGDTTVSNCHRGEIRSETAGYIPSVSHDASHCRSLSAHHRSSCPWSFEAALRNAPHSYSVLYINCS